MPTTRIALLVVSALAAPAALAALDNYTINLRRDTGGLNIEASATPGPMAAVQIQNRGSTRARCFVDFEGGRLTPVRREAWLDGGTQALIQQPINDPEISSLSVAVSCDTLSADEPIPAANALGSAIVRGNNGTGTGTTGTGTTGTGTGTGTTGTGTTGTGTPTDTTARGAAVRTTSATSTRTDAGASRTTRPGTTTIISPGNGSTATPAAPAASPAPRPSTR